MRGGAILRARVVLAVIVVLLSLSLLPISCSSEEQGGRSGEGQRADAKQGKQSGSVRTEGAQEPAKDAGRPEPPVALVPIAHLGSTLENVSTKDLSKARGLAVARTSRGEAGKLVGRSEFESFDSPDAVVEHVSTTPGALGLVPWNEVSPRVKALSVNGESLLDPEASGAENYPLKPEGATVPDPGEAAACGRWR